MFCSIFVSQHIEALVRALCDCVRLAYMLETDNNYIICLTSIIVDKHIPFHHLLSHSKK